MPAQHSEFRRRMLALSHGGHVRGPGSGTSDSIPARLSDGEFVLPADTVRKVGVKSLRDLVRMTHTPSGNPPRRGHFADGDMPGEEDRKRQASFGDAAAAAQDGTVTQVGASAPAAQPSAAPTGGLQGVADRVANMPGDDGWNAVDTAKAAALGAGAAAYGAGKALAPVAPALGYASGGQMAADIAKSAASAVKSADLPGAPAGKLAGLGTLGALASTAHDAWNTPTEDYRKRFGMETSDPSLGGDLVARGLGAASDLGNAMTLGLAGKLFRDKQEPAAQLQPPKPASPPGYGQYNQGQTMGPPDLSKLPASAPAPAPAPAAQGQQPSYGPIGDRTTLTNEQAAVMNPAGRITVKRGANGTMEFSGGNVSGQVSYNDPSGKALPGGGINGKGFSDFQVAPVGTNVALGPNGSGGYAFDAGTQPRSSAAVAGSAPGSTVAPAQAQGAQDPRSSVGDLIINGQPSRNGGQAGDQNAARQGIDARSRLLSAGDLAGGYPGGTPTSTPSSSQLLASAAGINFDADYKNAAPGQYAADLLGARSGAESLGRLMASGQIAAPQAGFSGVIGTSPSGLWSRTPEQQRRDAEVQATSIHKQTAANGRAALQGMDAQDLANIRAQGELQQEGMRQAGGLQREGMQQAGANQREGMQQSGETARTRMRAAVDQQRVGIDSARLGMEQTTAAFQNRTAQRVEKAQQDLINADTPEKQRSARDRLLALGGKHDSVKDRYITTGGETRVVDGQTVKDPQHIYDTVTGQWLQPQGQSAATAMPASQKEMVKGQVYQTARGPARWDGKQFQLVR